MSTSEDETVPVRVKDLDGEIVGWWVLSVHRNETLWDGTVHATREAAQASIDQITDKPEWYSGERAEDWEVVALVRLEQQS